MLVRAIRLGPEGIARVRELRAEEMDAAMMGAAEDALARLRAGAERVVHPLPDDPDLVVGLGTPYDPRVAEALERHWRERHRDADPSEYAAMSESLDRRGRRTTFHLARGEKSACYHLVPADVPESGGSLVWLVGGELAGASILAGVRGSLEAREALRVKVLEVVAEIVALKPAFLAPKGPVGRAGMLADHFAVAMLASDLGPEPPG